MRVYDPSSGTFIDSLADDESDPNLSLEALEEARNKDGLLTFRQVALFKYAECGSLAAVARDLKTSVYELTKLSRSDWWIRELEAYQREERASADTKLTRLMGKTLTEIEDRLENGDVKMTAMGEEKRVKVDANTLARLYLVMFDKRQLIRGEPTHIDAANEKLKELTEKLRTIGSSRIPITIEASDNGTETE